ncbi:MFS general substrate transporter [Suillus cothurnatus]|nr:MFS general substrate transporter [Suillus cothurnatus]
MTKTAEPPSSAVVVADKRPGASWKKAEEHVIPKNRMGIVCFGLMCTIFLVALDQTIVATALPTIIAQLGGAKYYSWVGSAYMLVCAALSPLYGKLSDILGRKPVLYGCILMFLIGSALCGAAQSMTWLIISRAVQGIGGGIFQLVQITISDIVPLQERGKYTGLLGATWGIASVIGPLFGGILTDHVSWRCLLLLIDRPTGGLAGILLFFFLNLNPHQGKSLRDHIREFDFVGLFAIIIGVVCLLIGLNSSDTTWKNPETIALLAVGGALLIIGGINEIFTKKSPLIPPRLFKTRTTGLTLVSVFLHAMLFFAGVYLPMYYQVLGASATSSGVRMLPFSLSSSVTTWVCGIVVVRTGSYRPIMWLGWIVMTLGWGLMIMLDNKSTIAAQEIYPFIASLGIGCLFQTPLIAIQAAMPLKDMATSVGAFMLLRTLGSTIGMSVGEVIISSALEHNLQGIQGLTIDTSAAALNGGVKQITSISNSTSISTIWLVATPLSAFGLFLILFIRDYTLKRTTVRSGDKKLGDAETGTEQAIVADDFEAMELETLEMPKIPYDANASRDSLDDISKQKI